VSSAKYVRLKKELAKKFENDREAYTNGKTGFIEKIVDVALKQK